MKHATVRKVCPIIGLALTALSSFAQTVSEPYTFTTLAGAPGYRGVDGTGSAARFFLPQGVAVDNGGNLFVADSANHTIRKVTPVGEVTTLAGRAGSPGSAGGTGSAARFNFPSGVGVDTAGNVFVADTGNSTIRKISPAGVVTTLAGLANQVGYSDGLGGLARFYQPSGIALDDAGNLYVADSKGQTIRKVTPAGEVTTFAGHPSSIGHADGTTSTARFHDPVGVAVDAARNVYVVDSSNHAIRKITPNGVVTTLAGRVLIKGSADGMGSDARFWDPRGITVDTAGNVYVSDSGNETIRKITPTGVVTTLAGLPQSYGSTDGTGAPRDSAARWGLWQIGLESS